MGPGQLKKPSHKEQPFAPTKRPEQLGGGLHPLDAGPKQAFWEAKKPDHDAVSDKEGTTPEGKTKGTLDLFSFLTDPQDAIQHMGRGVGKFVDGAAQRVAGAAGFEQVTTKTDGKSVAEQDAPKHIVLPPALVQGMQKAWDGSIPMGKSQEQGGILVRNKDGSYEWKAGAAGESGSFDPNYDDKGKDQSLAVLGHTHPYDETEGGYTNVPFSGQDLARQVYSDEPVNVVQSGKGMFGTARTAEFDKMVAGLDEKAKRKMFQDMNKEWNDLFSSGKGELPGKADAATRAICHKYHLLYYKGEGDSLDLVDTAAKEKQRDATPGETP